MFATSSQPDALVAFGPVGDLWRSNPDQCCGIRKIIPLCHTLKPFSCWINEPRVLPG
jgi:hypothetical protein